MSSITGDSLKNYYTFAYFIKNDHGFLNFTGMNYPFGEHVTYIDCQPGVSWLLKLMPFTHNYLVGILHGLIFASFIISPLILNTLFKKLGLNVLPGFMVSLGITLLSPQFFRIYEGHYTLAYACIIPLSMLLIVNFLKSNATKDALWLFTFNTLIFLIHPYTAFGLCIFTLLSLLIFAALNFERKTFTSSIKWLALTGLAPLLLFKLFMLTDHHLKRTTEPYGLNASVSTPGSILVPVTGPFKQVMEAVFKTQPGEFEGYCYLGIALIALLFIFVLSLPFIFKRLRFQKEAVALLIASSFLLLFSLGVHAKIFTALGISSAALNQFRALGRFSWFFYYTLPVFLFVTVYHSFKHIALPRPFNVPAVALAFIFLCLNLTEADALFTGYGKVSWKDRNVFNTSLLSVQEKQVVESIQQQRPQAIIPLPTYYIGSEIYDRAVENSTYPLIPSLIYSFHSAVPLLSSMMSRTSITETEEGIGLLNSYRKNKPVAALLNHHPFMVIKTKTPLLPDEDRLWQSATVFQKSDSLQFGYISKSKLLTPALDKKIITITASQAPKVDSGNVIYLRTENRKPFIFSNDGEYEFILKADSNTISSGRYIVSLHYYYTRNTWKDVLCHLIVNKSANGSSEWQYFLPIRVLSGFYKDYGVFEYKIDLERNSSYEFIIKRGYNHFYRISDFMLRPEGTTVRLVNLKDTVYNNFPMY